MTYFDKARDKVAVRYGTPVRCSVQIIPPGLVAMHADTEGAYSQKEFVCQKASKRQTNGAGRQAVAVQNGGYRLQEAAQLFSRSLNNIRTLRG